MSTDGLVLDALSLTSPHGMLQGRGRFSFSTAGRSELDARWRDVDATVIAALVPLTAADFPRAHLSGSALLTWPGRLPTTTTTEGKLDDDRHRRGARVHRRRHPGGRWARRPLAVSYRQSLDGLTLGSLDADVVRRPRPSGALAAQRDHRAAIRQSSATLAQLQRLGVSLPAVLREIGADAIEVDGTVTGSLGDPRVTGRVGLHGGRIGEVSGITVTGDAAIDTPGRSPSPR